MISNKNESTTRCQGLVFDAGDILYDASLWRQWLTKALVATGVDITYETLIEKWEKLLFDVYRGRAGYWQRFGELLNSCGLSEETAAELTDAARDNARQAQSKRKLFEGVTEALAKLKEAGVKLAVLSDTEHSASKVKDVLISLNVKHYFDAVITSYDIGYVKPQRQAYEVAANALEIKLSQCGFVGHEPDELAGAKSAGMFTIAFNYHPEAEADVYIKHFSELKNIVTA